MTPTPVDFAQFRTLIDDLANAVQVVVLIAEHLEAASSVTAQDAGAITRNLHRVTTALKRIRTEGGTR